MSKLHDIFIDKVLSRWFLVYRKSHASTKLGIVKDNNGKWMRK